MSSQTMMTMTMRIIIHDDDYDPYDDNEYDHDKNHDYDHDHDNYHDKSMMRTMSTIS